MVKPRMRTGDKNRAAFAALDFVEKPGGGEKIKRPVDGRRVCAHFSHNVISAHRAGACADKAQNAAARRRQAQSAGGA